MKIGTGWAVTIIGVVVVLVLGKFVSMVVLANKNSRIGVVQYASSQWYHQAATEPVLAETLMHGATIEYYDLNGDTVMDLTATVPLFTFHI